jgi:hypothetical protein
LQQGSRIVKAILIAFAMCLAVTPSLAEEPDVNSGNFYVPICREAFSAALASKTAEQSKLENFAYGECVGTVYTLMKLGPMFDQQYKFCPPNTTVPDAFSVIAKYLEIRPQLMSQDFVTSAVTALAQAWPCK